MISWNFASGSLFLFAVLSVSCESGGICYAESQSELNEKLLDARCLDVRVLEFKSETLEATSERSDDGFELYVDAEYCSDILSNGCGDDPAILRHAVIDNIYTDTTNLGSVTVTRYRGGQLSAVAVDIELGEAPPSSAVSFQVLDGGTARLRSTADMDGWLRMNVSAVPSWEGVTLEIDPSAWPTTDLGISEGESISLAQLQQFGARAQDIAVGGLPVDVGDGYAAWLEAEGFTGTLTRFVDNETIVVLPRSTVPAP